MKMLLELQKIEQQIGSMKSSNPETETPSQSERAENTSTPKDSTKNQPSAASKPEGDSGEPKMPRSGFQELAGLIDDARKLLDKVPAGSDSDGTSSPLEDFRDRQAYRNELRSALTSIELDDLHDRPPNALYRFQFRAMVAPGNDVNRWGAAVLTIQPPVLTKEELQKLYLNWIARSTYRLNQHLVSEYESRKHPGSKKNLGPDPQYELIGRKKDLYEIVYHAFPKESEEGKKCKPWPPRFTNWMHLQHKSTAVRY
jgi:hypothetical protein